MKDRVGALTISGHLIVQYHQLGKVRNVSKDLKFSLWERPSNNQSLPLTITTEKPGSGTGPRQRRGPLHVGHISKCG